MVKIRWIERLINEKALRSIGGEKNLDLDRL